ncbi:MAG: PIN domain-containing protein [Candidatus Hydrogenedentota bacterium]
MKNIAIIDAGPLIALFDASDKYHQKVKEYLKKYKGYLITTIPVITEATHLLDFNIQAQLDLLKWIELGGVSIFHITEEHIKRIIKLIEKYLDRPMDFADASLIVLAEELNINSIISVDIDFYIYRLKQKKKFTNLLDI